jgi:hypothetical protein
VKTPAPYKVKIAVGDATVDIEGAEAGVVKIVEAISDVLRGGRKGTGSTSGGSSSPALAPASASAMAPAHQPHTDIRLFFSEKAPSSDVEAAAVTAYFYQYLAPNEEKQDYIDSSLLERAFRLGKRPLPAKVIYTLQNARNAGYLDALGDGRYKLTAVGYNLVDHTLGSSADGEGSPRPRRRKPKKAKRRKGHTRS